MAVLALPRQKQILFGLLGVIGLIVWVNFFLIPQRRAWVTGRSRIQALRGEIASVRQKLNQLPVLENELANVAAQYPLPAVAVATEEQLPQLLEKIAQTAHLSQVRLLGVKPKGGLNRPVPDPSGFLVLSVLVEASAGYHELGMFLDALERSEALVRVQEMKIQADPKDRWHHQASFLLQVYYPTK